MGDNREFEFEGAASPSEAADTLVRLAEGIRAGSLSLSMGWDEITVSPQGDFSLEIEASERKGKDRIEMTIAWKQPKDVEDDEDDAE
jgi:amphi-Trp domain-containing protein